MSCVAGLRRSPSFDSGVQSRSAASALGAVALALAGLAGAWSLDGHMAAARLPVALPPTRPVLGFLLDPSPMVAAVAGTPTLSGFTSVPGAVAMASAAVEAAAPEAPQATTAPQTPPATPNEAITAAAVPLAPIEQAASLVPFPPPRPLDLARAVPAAPVRFAVRPRFGRPGIEASAVPVDNRGFFEKMFGLNKPAGDSPAMAYAPAETTQVGRSLGLASSFPAPGGGGTAVYDIASHTVTLPNGTRLEAHSGLGDHLDDPGGVHLRMRGATPPHTYDLSLREKLFHGVRALRLTPIGGGHIYGRDGLLAHTYMLGPNGQSNGCVSFRDYNSFLQAFERGDVKRLVVVGRS